MPQEKEELVGKITHYFPKIGVAVIDLSGNLKTGDKIKIIGDGSEFEQEVDSMEIERQKVSEAQAGQKVGLKLKETAREGFQIYKI